MGRVIGRLAGQPASRPRWLLAMGWVACAPAADRPADVDVVAASLGDIEVLNPVLPAPPTRDVAALYFTARNTGDMADTLTGMSSAIISKAEFHRSETGTAVARMRATGPIEIPAGGEVRFEPGGLHVMLHDLHRDLVPGDTVSVTLHFWRTGSILLDVPVRSYADLVP